MDRDGTDQILAAVTRIRIVERRSIVDDCSRK